MCRHGGLIFSYGIQICLHSLENLVWHLLGTYFRQPNRKVCSWYLSSSCTGRRLLKCGLLGDSKHVLLLHKCSMNWVLFVNFTIDLLVYYRRYLRDHSQDMWLQANSDVSLFRLLFPITTGLNGTLNYARWLIVLFQSTIQLVFQMLSLLKNFSTLFEQQLKGTLLSFCWRLMRIMGVT